MKKIILLALLVIPGFVRAQTATFTPTNTFTSTPTPAYYPGLALENTQRKVLNDLNSIATSGIPQVKTPTPTNTFTPTFTPTGTLTPTVTPTPLTYIASVDSSSSTPVTFVAANASYFNNIVGFNIINASAVAGAFYIDDGTVTLQGPMTVGAGVGINVDRKIAGQAMNRGIIFHNIGGVADMMGSLEYTVDLTGVR